MFIKRTFDINVIDSVLKHAEVRPYICDDDSSGDVNYPISENIYYLAVYHSNELAGLFVLYPVNNITLEVHTNFLPRFRGKLAIKAAKLGLMWVFNNTKFSKINGSTPEYNKRAIYFNKKVGFEIEGMNKGSIMKNGELHNQIYFGLERDKWV